MLHGIPLRPLLRAASLDPAERAVENYFNYFTEIEEHFQKRRGGGLLLSTLDWALIESWKDAGIPLEAVLRGIDAAFDRYEQRPSKSKKVNSLAYCAQEVLTAAEDMKEAAVGAHSEVGSNATARAAHGFDPASIAAFLRRSADVLEQATFPQAIGVLAKPVACEAVRTLRELAEQMNGSRNSSSAPETALMAPASPASEKKSPVRLEDLERRLTVIEEKLFAALLAVTPDEQIVRVRAEADRDLAPYRSKMPGSQIEQLQKQYVHKRVLERYGLPRLSLFYM